MAYRDDGHLSASGEAFQAPALVIAEEGRPSTTLWTESQAAVAAAVLLLASVCALLLILPGETVVTKYVNDLFIFLDGAHRVASGQVPNRDFHAALGPLVYYVPAAGLLLSGSMGGAMTVGTALVLLAVAPAMAHILGTRMRPAVALPVAAFLLLILAVPINVGEGIAALSFGMFYNRIGWAALAALLIMYLRPYHAHRRQTALDTACAAFLVLLLLYTKITYGLVAVAFVGFMLLDRKQRVWAALALALVVGGALIVETFWQSSAAHFADLKLASQVSGMKGEVADLAYAFLGNLADYVLFVLIAGLALRRTRSFRDLLFFGFCAVAGFMIVRQNFQGWGILTLHAGAAVAVEMLLRSQGPLAPTRRQPVIAASPLLLLGLLLPTIVHCAMALGLHATLASTRSGQEFGLPKFDKLRLVNLLSPGDYEPSAKYLATLQDGGRALAELGGRPGKVFVLDFINPFSAGLGLPPARGDSSWQHWERNFDESHYVPPEQLFREVRIVMEPKWPAEEYTARGLLEVYGGYLEANFELAHETQYWKLYVGRDRRLQSIVTR
jgi:hypothetical protein